jgi:hypothetical protein
MTKEQLSCLQECYLQNHYRAPSPHNRGNSSPPSLPTAPSRGPPESFFCFRAWRIPTCTWLARCCAFRQLVLLHQRRFSRKLDSIFSACYQVMKCNASGFSSSVGLLVSMQRILPQYTVTSMLVHFSIVLKRSGDKLWLWYNEIYWALI